MRLPPKERQLLELMVRGFKPAAVCEALQLKYDAYQSTRRRLLERLGATNDAQLGALAYQYGYVPFDVQNQIHDRSQERLDSRRSNGGKSLGQFLRQQGAR